MGRKPTYDREAVLSELEEWLSQGKTMRAYCAQEGKPDNAQVYRWMGEDEDFAQRIARARDVGHDAIADDCLRIADEMPPSDENGRTDSGFVAWQKNRVWTRTQLLAKWSPKKYGDKVDVTHGGQVGLSINIDLGD